MSGQGGLIFAGTVDELGAEIAKEEAERSGVAGRIVPPDGRQATRHDPGALKKKAAMMAELQSLAPDKHNSYDKYDYLSAGATFAAVRPLCAKHGLIVSAAIERIEVVGRGAEGKQTKYLRVYLRFAFVDIDTGAEIDAGVWPGEAPDSQSAVAAAAVKAEKLWLATNLLIDSAAQEDDEQGHQGQGEAQQRGRRPAKAAADPRQALKSRAARCGRDLDELTTIARERFGYAGDRWIDCAPEIQGKVLAFVESQVRGGEA